MTISLCGIKISPNFQNQNQRSLYCKLRSKTPSSLLAFKHGHQTIRTKSLRNIRSVGKKKIDDESVNEPMILEFRKRMSENKHVYEEIKQKLTQSTVFT